MIIDKEILQSLQAATLAAVAASGTPNLPIKMAGRSITPPNDGKYLEVIFIPNNIAGEFWGNEKTHRGVFRLVLHWPNDNLGDYAPMMALGSIAGYFSKDRLLSNSVKIYEGPDFMGSIEDGATRLFPVNLRYQRFVS
jgi:hypothetical protein